MWVFWEEKEVGGRTGTRTWGACVESLSCLAVFQTEQRQRELLMCFIEESRRCFRSSSALASSHRPTLLQPSKGRGWEVTSQSSRAAIAFSWLMLAPASVGSGWLTGLGELAPSKLHRSPMSSGGFAEGAQLPAPKERSMLHVVFRLRPVRRPSPHQRPPQRRSRGNTAGPARRLFIGSGIGGTGVQCGVDVGFIVDNIYDTIFFIQQERGGFLK